ncbi:MAG: DUF262 domain-containing protein [Brevinema sp.]
MSNSTMTSTSFSDLLDKNKWQVPEIQREYVWGHNPRLLEHFFKDIANNKAHNIGFLYSYTPLHSSEGDIVYLIDGQQRFTTLYLALFYFSRVEGNDFKSYEGKFSYKVRTSTDEFTQRLIEKVKSQEDFENIEDQTWFLSHYQNDPSIKGILVLFEWLTKNYKISSDMVDKILATEFWNFNIDQAGQGEELYIKMNSRGEQLSANENIRPYLLEKASNKTEAGKEIDNWQEFFWKYRGINPNADEGFNAFLSWVVILELHKLHTDASPMLIYNEQGFRDIQNNLYHNAQRINLTFEKIQLYFDAITKIAVAVEKGHFDSIAPKLTKESINNEQRNNFKNYLAGGIQGRGKMFLLPLLAFYSKPSRTEIDKRWVRFFYNIAFNQGRDAFKYVFTIASCPVDDPINIDENLLDEEDKTKLKWLAEADDLEKIFQELEDHPITKGTIGVFITHITHSLQNEKLDIDERLRKYIERLREYKEKFELCLPTNGKIFEEIGNSLFRQAMLATSESMNALSSSTSNTLPVPKDTYCNIGNYEGFPRYFFKIDNTSFAKKYPAYFRVWDMIGSDNIESDNIEKELNDIINKKGELPHPVKILLEEPSILLEFNQMIYYSTEKIHLLASADYRGAWREF